MSLPLLKFVSVAFVGAQEEPCKDEAANAETREHDLGCGVGSGGVTERAVYKGKTAKAEILNRRHESEGSTDALFLDNERNRGPHGGGNQNEGNAEHDHAGNGVPVGDAHDEVRGDEQERAGDHQCGSLADAVDEITGEGRKDH